MTNALTAPARPPISVRYRRRTAAWVALGLLAWVLAAVSAGAQTSDSFVDSQWALGQIRAPEAWAEARGAGVLIGVVDTGVDLDHPDLAGKVAVSADCIGGPCRVGGGDDGHGHGTLVAGIAAAVTDNGRGVAGVAPAARLVVAKAIGADGEGEIADIDRAIRWVVEQGAKVVNLSIGDPNVVGVTLLGTPLRPAIEFAWSRGAIPVLASGNQSTGLIDLGSSNYGDLDAVVVGATTRDGRVAPYSSSIGTAKWGVVAPGGAASGNGDDILSTFLDGGYALTSGTSMATPHVSGALAVLVGQGLSAPQAVDILLATLDRSSPCGLGCQGRLDLGAAAVAAASAVVLPPPTTTTAPPTITAPVTTVPVPATTVPTTTTDPDSGDPGSGNPAPPGPGDTTTTTDPPTVSVDRPGQELAVPIGAPGESRALPVAVAISLGAAAWAGVGAVGWRRLRDAA